jgi:hypothetical protein
MKCDEIQPLLMSYMGRELGESQSALVREHLRRCDVCREESRQMSATLELLRASAGGEQLPERLSDRRRRRLMRIVTSPIMAWIDEHHTLVAILTALLTIVVAFVLLGRIRIYITEQVPASARVIMLRSRPHQPPEPRIPAGPDEAPLLPGEFRPPEVAIPAPPLMIEPPAGMTGAPPTLVAVTGVTELVETSITVRVRPPARKPRRRRVSDGGIHVFPWDIYVGTGLLVGLVALLLRLRRWSGSRRDPDKTPENGPPFQRE